MPSLRIYILESYSQSLAFVSAVQVIVTLVSLYKSRIYSSLVQEVVGIFQSFKHPELVTLKFTSVVYTRLELDVSVIVYVTVYEPMSLMSAWIYVLASAVTVDVPLVVNVSPV